MSMPESTDVTERVSALEKAQAVQAATQAGAEATQAAAQAGMTATQAAAQAGTVGMMAAGAIGLIVGISSASPSPSPDRLPSVPAGKPPGTLGGTMSVFVFRAAGVEKVVTDRSSRHHIWPRSGPQV